nr:hypothetical protein [Tanacetum cinerariifolium]
QFWTSVAVKKVHDVTRLQDLVDKKKVVITEALIRDALCLDDTEGKGFSRVETSLFEGMIVEQQVAKGDDDEVRVEDVNAAGVATEGVVSAVDDIVPTADDEPSILSPTPPTPAPQPSQGVPSTSQDAKDVVVDAKDGKDVDIDETADIQGRTADSTITAADVPIPAATTAAPILTAALSKRRKGVVIRDPQETTTPSTIIHSEAKSKDKGKGILVEEPKPLKKQAQIEQDEAYARELEAEPNKNIDWDEVIDHVQRKQKKDKAMKRYQALKRKPQTEAQARKNMMLYLKNVARFKMDYFKVKKKRWLKKQKLDEEVEELKRYLQIVPNDENFYYIVATPLARKVPVVDYEIYNGNNKPYYKIKRADGSHQLYMSFLSLLMNFDREDLEDLWSLVKERFSTAKPKNFSDDFLLITLGAMFEKPDIHAQIWKNQRSVHGHAKVKSWKLLESCGVQIITFTTTQLILLVERRYPLTRFTLDQMLNNVRLEVEEGSGVSLELLRFIRQQHQEGAQLNYGVDTAMDFKENMLSV